MTLVRRRLAILSAAAGIAALLLSGCSGPVPPPVDSGDSGDSSGSPAPAPADVPAWYGDSFDGDGCPIPRDGDLQVAADPAALLKTDLPDGWCMYKATDYSTYFAIPSTKAPDFGADVRAALEPAGWTFDPADDDSPQWSWITAFPDGAAEGFEDGAVDGAIFVTGAISQDDIDTYSLWFSSLTDAFAEWAPGDAVSVVGFW